MTDRKKPTPLDDQDVADVQGGGRLDSAAGTLGYEAITLERGVKAPYIGETEKNARKRRGGVFEPDDER